MESRQFPRLRARPRDLGALGNAHAGKDGGEDASKGK